MNGRVAAHGRDTWLTVLLFLNDGRRIVIISFSFFKQILRLRQILLLISKKSKHIKLETLLFSGRRWWIWIRRMWTQVDSIRHQGILTICLNIIKLRVGRFALIRVLFLSYMIQLLWRRIFLSWSWIMLQLFCIFLFFGFLRWK